MYEQLVGFLFLFQIKSNFIRVEKNRQTAVGKIWTCWLHATWFFLDFIVIIIVYNTASSCLISLELHFIVQLYNIYTDVYDHFIVICDFFRYLFWSFNNYIFIQWQLVFDHFMWTIIGPWLNHYWVTQTNNRMLFLLTCAVYYILYNWARPKWSFFIGYLPKTKQISTLESTINTFTNIIGRNKCLSEF